MKLFIRSIAVATLVLGIFMGAVSAVEEEYEGASYCRDYPAWPGGTYLGQMHPYHSSFYTGFAERRGWNACETWANDQRNSAIRGLRELGYSVTASGDVAHDPTRQFSGTGPTLTDQFDLSAGIYVVKTTFANNRGRYLAGNFYVNISISSTGETEQVAREIWKEQGIQYSLLRVPEDSTAAVSVDAVDAAIWNVRINLLN